jgi:formate hydrogenlyase subunit 6/NADH:ubiquinone oxidoreductase subunit I
MATQYSLLDRLRVPVYDDSRQVQFGALSIDTDKCDGCGICVWVCPGACLVSEKAKKLDIMSGRVKGGRYGIPYLEPTMSGAQLCIACADCGTACPLDAMTVTAHFDPGYHFKRLTQTSEMRYPKRY